MRRVFLLLLCGACERRSPAPPTCACADAGRDVREAREPPALAKRHTLERMLAQGPVLVRLDARQRGVVVPPEHAANPSLVLRVGRDLAPRIPDLEVTATGIAATLGFHGHPFHCTIPWSAVYGLQLDLPPPEQLWEDEIPPAARSAASDAGPR